MACLFISAAHKSSGKTTVSVGLCAALRKRGHIVQPFKKGPDYIDPVWLGMAAENPCYTLDFYTAGHQETADDFFTRGADADYAIVEGNKGLYDGLDLDGSNSNAALAKALQTPVILVIDCRGMMRGIAPLLLGYQAFGKDLTIAGVIANKTGAARHQSKLRMAVEHYTDIAFLGALERNDDMLLPEQHIGLIPAYENPQADRKIDVIRKAVEHNVDIDLLLSLATDASQPPAVFPRRQPEFVGLKIGVARDKAFGFYYPGDLERFEQLGATLIPFDAFTSPALPEVDGLFIGGGFPERHGQALQDNNKLRASIRSAIDLGMPVYAECGGLMYLAESLTWNGRTHQMVGALPGDVIMHDKPQGRGYVQLREREHDFPWPADTSSRTPINAHEFHYSSLHNVPAKSAFAYSVERGTGIDGKSDGLLYKNVMASYAHRRDTRQTPWVHRFLTFVSQQTTCNTPIKISNL